MMKKTIRYYCLLCSVFFFVPATYAQESLLQLLQAGDSCMSEYNTYAAMQYYQQALAEKDCAGTRIPLADCLYKRMDYRRCVGLLSPLDEDSLTHNALRQIVFCLQKLADNQSLVYWGEQLIHRYPMDGEVVARLAMAYTETDQPHNGVRCAEEYFQKDSSNIEVNRALGDCYFFNREYRKAAGLYERLLAQGDSTFNTLYSVGMCYAQMDSLELARQQLSKAAVLNEYRHFGCVQRLGAICVDLKHYDEGVQLLNRALDLILPDTTVMRKLTLSLGEGYYMDGRYREAIDTWKMHLDYNPGSLATYYNIAQTYEQLLRDRENGVRYYQLFLEKARQETANQNLADMIRRAETSVEAYRLYQEQQTEEPAAHEREKTE